MNEGEAGDRAPEVTLGDGKVEGEVADTNTLDLSQTERFEVQTLSMDQADAGAVMEPFNMNNERREGHFDDDFNFVWKRKGEGEHRAGGRSARAR